MVLNLIEEDLCGVRCFEDDEEERIQSCVVVVLRHNIIYT